MSSLPPPRTALPALILAILILAPASGHAQLRSAIAGAKRGQYKRNHQVALEHITAGDTEAAVRWLEDQLAEDAADPETHFMLAVARARAGDRESALGAVRTALSLGLPLERIVCGSNPLLGDLTRDPVCTELTASLASRPIHGPVVGDLRPDGARVWLRTLGERTVRILLSDSPARWDGARATEAVTATAASDHTAEVRIDGLKPSTRYYYRVRIGETAEEASAASAPVAEIPETWSFVTPPAEGTPSRFTLGFGGGAGYTPANERMWITILDTAPDLFLLLGDNVYIDSPENAAMQDYCYHRRQSRPEFRRFSGRVPLYSIWDDHDFGTNDCHGGPDPDVPAWKRPVFDVFARNWPNPDYAGGADDPGCYYDFTRGDVHFVMLDGRYHRTDPEAKEKAKEGEPTMLGPAQKKWLLETLGSSRGVFKILCSPVPWVYEAKGDSLDTWNGYKGERDEIFDFIRDRKIGGVVLLSADRHRSDLWKISHPGLYPLYEMNSSRLTNIHVHPTMEEAVFSYNEKQSFGLLDIDTEAADPSVRYRIVNIDGETMFEHTLRRSECEPAP